MHVAEVLPRICLGYEIPYFVPGVAVILDDAGRRSIRRHKDAVDNVAGELTYDRSLRGARVALGDPVAVRLITLGPFGELQLSDHLGEFGVVSSTGT